MPFNMNEEMEEGYYDEEGNFVFNKEKDEIHDQWLDNLDWDSVKQKAGGHWNKMVGSWKTCGLMNSFQDDEGDADSEPAKIDGVGACERVLTYLTTDNMTVNDVLKKLNSQKSKLNLEPYLFNFIFRSDGSRRAQTSMGSKEERH
jgi:hypothetical protein